MKLLPIALVLLVACAQPETEGTTTTSSSTTTTTVATTSTTTPVECPTPPYELGFLPQGVGAAGAATATATGGVATAATDPQAIMEANQCSLCHALEGEGGPIGPAFDGIGERLDAEAIRRSILEPNADTAQGYENVAGTMPTTFGEQLTAAQLEAVVSYLSSLR